jgi:hypothetical protein
MDITGLSQGDELQLLVSDGRIVNIRPFRVRPEDQVSEQASETMDLAERAFEEGEFEVEDLEHLVGTLPASQPTPVQEPIQEPDQLGLESPNWPGTRRGRRSRWPRAQRVPGYATYGNRFGPPDDLSAQIFTGRSGIRVGPRNFRRDDDKIYDRVGEALSDAGLDVADVEIAVQQGVVKLSGTVADRWHRLAAEEIASEVLGVQDVENDIRVRPAPPTAAGPSPVPDRMSIAQAIERARLRRGAEAGTVADEY